MTLDEYIQRIDNFIELTPAEKIPYFAYYIINYTEKSNFTAKDIDDCFSILCFPKYSNSAAYLTKRTKRPTIVFIKDKNGYTLERSFTQEIAKNIGDKAIIKYSQNLFPIELLDHTRTYLINMGKQAIGCYDYGWYDACLVMTRKLIETLIIELFEKNKIESKIKDTRTNNYYFLTDLVSCLLGETSWTIGRNSKEALPLITKLCNQGAHNRRFNARKSDIDKIANSIRIVIEELVLLINYPDWNISK